MKTSRPPARSAALTVCGRSPDASAAASYRSSPAIGSFVTITRASVSPESASENPKSSTAKVQLRSTSTSMVTALAAATGSAFAVGVFEPSTLWPAWLPPRRWRSTASARLDCETMLSPDSSTIEPPRCLWSLLSAMRLPSELWASSTRAMPFVSLSAASTV